VRLVIKLILALGLVGVLGACRGEPSVDTTNGRSVGSLIQPEIPLARAGDPGWAYRREAQSDLDGDGDLETITLLSDVTLDARGQPLWEDGHRWQLYVAAPGSEPTRVYARFLPMGTLTAELTGPTAPATRPSIVLLERTADSVSFYEISYGPAGPEIVTALRRTIDPSQGFAGSSRP
jgi:hypothetical protein